MKMERAKAEQRIKERGLPMNPKGYEKWDRLKGAYPHHVVVNYMSTKDIDPDVVHRKVTKDFIRVVFNGQTHWGFYRASDCEAFQRMAGIKR